MSGSELVRVGLPLQIFPPPKKNAPQTGSAAWVLADSGCSQIDNQDQPSHSPSNTMNWGLSVQVADPLGAFIQATLQYAIIKTLVDIRNVSKFSRWDVEDLLQQIQCLVRPIFQDQRWHWGFSQLFRGLFYKDTSPFMRSVLPGSKFFLKSFTQSIYLGLGFQYMNFERTQISRPNIILKIKFQA